MKHPFFFLGMAFVFAACGGSNKAVMETAAEVKATSSPVSSITVDGGMQDWHGIALLTTNSGIEYAVAHSRDHLYLLFKIADPAEQMKFIRGGMEVWFDPTGRHAKTTEVIYPVKGELPDDTFRPNIIPGEKPNKSDKHRLIESGLVSFNRIGFRPEYSGVQSIRENTGFKGAINWNEADELIYEVAVPFAAFPTDARKTNMEIGFFIGAMEKPKASSDGGAMPMQTGGMGVGGGMRGGGGRRGGYGGNGQRGMNGGQRSAAGSQTNTKKMYEPESFWLQYAPI